jgi:hypothetical protein
MGEKRSETKRGDGVQELREDVAQAIMLGKEYSAVITVRSIVSIALQVCLERAV